jgi:glutamate--cysteine ligase
MMSPDQLLAIYQPEGKDPYRPLVGFEYEVHLFHAADLRPLAYGEPGGIREILEETAAYRAGRLDDNEPANKVYLPDGALISVEPGGQFEFSSAPMETFAGCLHQLREHLLLLEHLRRRFDLHLFFGGVSPVHTVEEIGLVVANERYRMMNDYFPRVGKMGRNMMRQTCSIQVTFDFETVALGAELLRAALYLAPVAGALFANAPYLEGRRTGYLSARLPIWADTDRARSGLPPGFSRPDYSFRDYLEFALAAPMFCVRSQDGLVDAKGMTFAEYNRRGFAGQSASSEDFSLHNSTIFADARLKQTVEVRTIDGQAPAAFPGVFSFLCGLLLCRTARIATLSALQRFPEKRLRMLSRQLGQEGIRGDIDGRPASALYLELLDIAAQGLVNCFPDGRDAVGFLDPVRDLVERKCTPADLVLDRFGDDARAWLRSETDLSL